MTTPSDVSRLADNPPGYDEENPYEDVDIDTLPAWWRQNVEEFRKHGLRAYRPPRLEDEELAPPVVAELEAEFAVSIRMQVLDPQDGHDWEIVVDGESVATVERERHVDGYSLFRVTRDELRRVVRNAS